MSISEEELDIAIVGLGFSGVAATTEGNRVSPKDLRTDMRGALESFLDFVTTGGVP